MKHGEFLFLECIWSISAKLKVPPLYAHPTSAGWEMLLSQSPHHSMQTPLGALSAECLERTGPDPVCFSRKFWILTLTLTYPAWKEATVRCCTASAVRPCIRDSANTDQRDASCLYHCLLAAVRGSWGSGHSYVGGGFNCTPSSDGGSETGSGFPGPSSAISL